MKNHAYMAAVLFPWKCLSFLRMTAMHAIQLLHKHLKNTCPFIHSKRLDSLMCATRTLSEHQRLSITELGRALQSQTSVKHNIKRIDRLIGNVWLRSERESIYQSISH